MVSLLVEGGGRIHGAFVAAGAADEMRLFLAPKLLGAGRPWLDMAFGGAAKRIADAFVLSDLEVERVGTDLLVTARFPAAPSGPPSRAP